MLIWGKEWTEDNSVRYWLLALQFDKSNFFLACLSHTFLVLTSSTNHSTLMNVVTSVHCSSSKNILMLSLHLHVKKNFDGGINKNGSNNFPIWALIKNIDFIQLIRFPWSIAKAKAGKSETANFMVWLVGLSR